METAMLRYDEIDAENRALRAAKYELEAKVRSCIPDLTAVQEACHLLGRRSWLLCSSVRTYLATCSRLQLCIPV